MSLALIDPSGAPPLMPRRGEQGVTIGRAVDHLLEIKRAANLRPATIANLRRYLHSFIRGREHVPISAFTIDVIESWFLNRKETPATQSSNMGRLSSLFSFAVRRQWIADNPTRYMEKIRIERKPPFILTPLQTALILDYARRRKPGQLAFWTLGLLAGVRPDEIARLTWSAVNIEDGCVAIDAAASKVRSRRIVNLEPTALAWMKLAHEMKAQLPCKRMTRRRYQRQASRLLGFTEWPHDCARHTAASYLLAKHRDAYKVAFGLGNSAGILERHYKQLVSAKDCAVFWAFMPDSPRPEKPAATPPPAPETPVLPGSWPLRVEPTLTRFERVEQALAMEPRIRALARQRQRAGSYHGGFTRQRLTGERFDTIREIGKIASCSRQTVQFARVIIRHADPDVLDKLRSGKVSIAGTYRKLVAELAASPAA